MAIFHSTVCKKLRKSFGTVTACRLMGQNILRDKVTDVRNPRTLPQRQQRERMKTLVELAAVFAQPTTLGFPQRPQKQNPDNQFVQLNMGAVEVSDELEVTVNYEQILVSKGNRALPEVDVTLDTENSVLQFTLAEEDVLRHAADDDMLYTVLLEQKLKRAKLFPVCKRKGAETTTINLPAKWDASQLLVYVFMLSKDRQNASVSKCLDVK